MSDIIKIAGIGLVTLFLSIMLKENRRDFALFCSLVRRDFNFILCNSVFKKYCRIRKWFGKYRNKQKLYNIIVKNYRYFDFN
jgi:hypothetical protein